MKTNNAVGNVRSARWAIALVALLCMGAAQSQSGGPLQISNAVFQNIEVKAPDGTVSTKRVPATTVVPGGVVVYEISVSNTGDQVATEIAIDNPLPAQVVFVDAATEPTVVSVDGGTTFDELAELTVPGPDGRSRAAQPSDITNLRWIIDSLAPGATGTLTFQARVK